MGMGKSLAPSQATEEPGSDEPGPLDLADALQAGVDMVRQRGKSDVGEKTMLDVLVPVCEALRDGAAQALPAAQLLDSLSAAGGPARVSSPRVRSGPARARASFLGERSVGHLDPGARSSQLIVDTVCATLRAGS